MPQMNEEKVIGIIPARWDSSRFPGKPLVDIGGKPMIRHVYERSMQARLLDKVIVATDDNRIADVVRSFNGEAVLTDRSIKTGTERVAQAVQNLSHKIIVNIQGDEPLISPKILDDLIQTLLDNPEIPVATPVKPITEYEELIDTSFARIVMTRDHRILYFTRAVIPVQRDEKRQEEWIRIGTYYRHVGIYGFRRDFLFQFVSMGPSPLEEAEQLEQLRILENGYSIKGVLTDYTPHSVDTPEDLEIVRKKYLSISASEESLNSIKTVHH